MFNTIDISTSGLVAQRQRMNTIAGNIANVNTTRDADGNASPFQRRLVVFSPDTQPEGSEAAGVGVRYEVQIDSQTPPRRVYDPGHQDADVDGYVAYPNIDMVTEFVNSLEASRAYEANVAAIDISKQMAELALEIIA